MNERLITAFNNYKGFGKKEDRICFRHPIKIERNSGSIFIYDMRITKIQTVMVLTGLVSEMNDRALLPISLLSDKELEYLLIKINEAS
jgi:hypothetical protein